MIAKILESSWLMQHIVLVLTAWRAQRVLQHALAQPAGELLESLVVVAQLHAGTVQPQHVID